MPLMARAGEATAQLRATIDDFVEILNNTPVAELRATGLPERAQRLVVARFDFAEMARRTMGEHWKLLNSAEQREFVDGFTYRLLASFGRTVRSSNGEKIQFTGEFQEGDQIRVETQIVGGDATPVAYKLHDVEGQWKVFDVIIDHVSLINNYRAQFDRVIAKSSVQDLLRKMKNLDS
jgi:phospholipid transport system substrate-binding protein